MKKLTLLSFLQIFIAFTLAQNLHIDNGIAFKIGDPISFKIQKDYAAISGFNIVITVYGTTNNLGCNPTASSIDEALGNASASGDCGTVTLTSSDGAISSSGCDRTQTRTWTATDACGAFVTASRTVVWKEDLTPPQITVTGSTENLGCNPTQSQISAAFGNAFVIDFCVNGTATVADGPIQSFDCSRSQTRTWTATDGCGNFASDSRTVTWIEATAPVIAITATDPDLGCNPGSAAINAALGLATVSAGCNVQLNEQNGLVQSSGCNRTQTRTWTATDDCGHLVSISRTATWTEDFSPPTISTVTDITQPADPGLATANVTIVAPTATDACGVSLSGVRSDNLSLIDPYPLGTTTITWTATDPCGNVTVRTQTITITDTEAPMINYCPTIQVQCFNSNSIYTVPVLLASDNNGAPSVSYSISGATTRIGTGSDASGFFDAGISIVNWKVTDAAGNSTSCSTTVTIDEIEASIPDAFADNITSAIGSPNTIYIGFGGKSITLTANIVSSIPGSYSYKWTIGSPGGTVVGTSATVTVTPTITTTYYLSIKDQNNCKQTVQVFKQITVTDIRCGTDKVFMCEMSKSGTIKTVCISTSKVPGEPAGSYLGQCVGTITRSGVEQKSEPTSQTDIGSLPKGGIR